MTQPTSFDTSAALRSIGVNRGTDLPALAPNIQQTVVMSDLSTNFAAQQFEARGFGTVFLGGVVAQFSVAQLIVNSAGGVVIERIDIFSDDGAGAPRALARMQAGPRTTLLLPTSPVVVNVGGIPVRSVLEQGHLVASGSSTVISLNAGFKTFENFGWFIPSGSAMRVSTDLVLSDLTVTFQWRELPQAA